MSPAGRRGPAAAAWAGWGKFQCPLPTVSDPALAKGWSRAPRHQSQQGQLSHGMASKITSVLFPPCKWHRTELCWWKMQILPWEERERATAPSLELLGSTEKGARNAECISCSVTERIRADRAEHLQSGCCQHGHPGPPISRTCSPWAFPSSSGNIFMGLSPFPWPLPCSQAGSIPKSHLAREMEKLTCSSITAPRQRRAEHHGGHTQQSFRTKKTKVICK